MRRKRKAQIGIDAIFIDEKGRILLGKRTREIRWFTPEEIRKTDLAFDHKKMLEDEGLIQLEGLKKPLHFYTLEVKDP